MSDGRRFRSALTRELYPVLRGEGFSGSGTALRREQGGVTHCFKLRISRDVISRFGAM